MRTPNFDEHLRFGSTPSTPSTSTGKATAATKLVRLAQARYRFAQADDGRAFAVPLDGPPIARPLDGSRASLRSELAAAYFAENGAAASRTALGDALGVLDGWAAEAEREPLALRTGTHDGDVVLDLGGADGRCLRIRAGLVEVVDRSPIVFRRTELTSAMPMPTFGADIGHLRDLVNVTQEDLPLLVGWALSTWLDIPRPILFLTGEQGCGKSSAARAIAQLLDPSPAPLRSSPRDVEAWVVAAAGSQVVALDNVSNVPDWLSDALCRAATGEGLVRRALYTNDGLSVVTFRRSVILTSIDAGALRGDLGERLVAVELEQIEPDRRRTDAELEIAFAAAAPDLLGALLDLAAKVLTVLPELDVADLPRMADFGRLLVALDCVTGWQSLDCYRDACAMIAIDVIAGDPLAAAIVELMATRLQWSGTAADLYAKLPRPEQSAWPKSPKSLGGALKRVAPALRGQGLDISWERTNTARIINITATEPGHEKVTL